MEAPEVISKLRAAAEIFTSTGCSHAVAEFEEMARCVEQMERDVQWLQLNNDMLRGTTPEATRASIIAFIDLYWKDNSLTSADVADMILRALSVAK